MIITKRNCIFVSDRQVTMVDGKTYGGVDKIFELSEIHSAGLMFNGIADFENVPIETLIGEFKIKTDFTKLSTIAEITGEFIRFISQNTEYSQTEELIRNMLKRFKEDLKAEFDDYGFEKTINIKLRKELLSFVKKFPNLGNEFNDIIPDGKDKEKFNRLIWEIFYNMQYEGTRIIIAGFNLNSHYPSFIEINLYCNDDGKIIYEEIGSGMDCREPFIKVFAINEEAYTFITGVNQEFIEYILKYINNANDSIISNLKWNLEKEKIENEDKIIEIVKKIQNYEYYSMSEDIDNFRIKCY